jgi:hypothetical protein
MSLFTFLVSSQTFSCQSHAGSSCGALDSVAAPCAPSGPLRNLSFSIPLTSSTTRYATAATVTATNRLLTPRTLQALQKEWRAGGKVQKARGGQGETEGEGAREGGQRTCFRGAAMTFGKPILNGCPFIAEAVCCKHWVLHQVLRTSQQHKDRHAFLPLSRSGGGGSPAKIVKLRE